MKCMICEHCGASLDFGEKCDCRENEERRSKAQSDKEEQKEKRCA